MPKRAALRRDLGEVIRIAKRLAALLDQNSHVLGEVSRGKSPSIESPSALLLDIAERAQIQLAAHRTGGGRDRAVPMILGRRFKRTPPVYVPAEVYCAMYISEGWDFLRGKAPGVRNKIAWKACENYWQAAGGARPSKTDTAARWERALRAAKNHPTAGGGALSSDRAMIRRDLESHWWGTE
jgi:hypothetical protein